MTAELSMHTSTKLITRINANDNTHLSGEVILSLHTKNAYSLCYGAWGYQKMGLMQFAELMSTLCLATKNDDPYAESFLLTTYDGIRALYNKIKQIESYCEKELTQQRGFEITVFSNPNPYKQSLKFYTPFSYMGARLLADLDYTFRQAYTLKQIGVLLPQDKLPAYLIPQLRNVFGQSRRWYYSGITRKDMRENNQKAQRMTASLGQVSPAILEGKIKFLFFPKAQWQEYFKKL